MLAWKIRLFLLRSWEFVRFWPYRCMRFVRWVFLFEKPSGRMSFIRWAIGLVMKAMDLLPVAVILEFFLDLLFWKTRPLTSEEKETIRSIFGHALQSELIGVDAHSWIAKKRIAHAYVSWHTVHFDGSISDATLIHEMVHIWQYQRHGHLYITESLFAQRWGGGYAYGGASALLLHGTKGLMAFNFEQQAEIIEDYYRLKNKLPLQGLKNAGDEGRLLGTYADEIKVFPSTMA